MRSLEEWVNFAFKKYKVSPKDQQLITTRLNAIKKKDPATFAHTIRVAFVATKISDFLGYNSRAFLFAGLEHDVGKTKVSKKILKKSVGFSKRNMKKMKHHVDYSYDELKNSHPFVSEIVIRHHSFQKEAYPKVMPKRVKPISKKTMDLINSYASVFSLADYYDAISSRKNDKFGGKAFTTLEIKEQMKKDRPEHAVLIEKLFANGIFKKSSSVAIRSTMRVKKRSVRNVIKQNKRKK